MTLRTRFAPSPTGYFHLGSARTALFAWLLARNTGGQCILRIEDTDKERSTPDAIEHIFEGLHWLGLDHDEGPFYQSERTHRYTEIIQILLESGHAYRCTCTQERLDTMREAQRAAKEKPRYDGCCREHKIQGDTDLPHVIRFKNPIEGDVCFQDQVHGQICFANSELDDLIIARTDGSPTYNLTVVVDDYDMDITHVIRGDDHLNNTPRQINILKALGADLPIYAHVPMILGPDGKKLSKRHGAASVLEYRQEGILPEALLNMLVRLGWAHGDQETFSVEEMIQDFSLPAINKSAARFNADKLAWLNQHYLKTLSSREIAVALQPFLEQSKINLTNGPDLNAVIDILKERSKTLPEMAESAKIFYQSAVTYNAAAVEKHLNPETIAHLKGFLQSLETVEWTAEALHVALKGYAEQHELKLGKIAAPLRVAVTGGAVSPSIDVTLELLGRDKVSAAILAL